MSADYSDRKHLTFEQAEGIEPLPTQLRPKEISKELRARLWAVVYASLRADDDGMGEVEGDWLEIAFDFHVRRSHRMADDFDTSMYRVSLPLKAVFQEGEYGQVFGLVQWLLRHPNCPTGLAGEVAAVLEECRSAYSLVDGDTIVPKGSDAETEIIQRAFVDVSTAEFGGARTHLRNSASELTQGEFAASIRESIHAVESVARSLVPGIKKLDDALAELSKTLKVHPSLRSGFAKLYGFTSDEQGIRHPLVDEPAAPVDETDALYMLGACAAFMSYLINKARSANLLHGKK